ncbi:MAG: enoyl-CoA hydratase-related protein [Mycobacteriales bacterium]
MGDPVLYHLEGGVATVTLNRPEALNACDVALKEGLLQALDQATGDATVRAVVLTGAGRAFCVGQDLREHRDRLGERHPNALDTVTRHYNPIVSALTNLAKPTVAAVNGVAAGAGAGFAFGCDFRVASANASFLLAFAGIGLSADSGTSWTLQRLVGYAKATELLLLAEPVAAAEALALGLVSQVVPLEALASTAAALAGRLATGPTAAYAAIKEALSFAATASLHDTLAREAVLQERAGATRDHHNAVAAFLAKTRPVFEGR